MKLRSLSQTLDLIQDALSSLKVRLVSHQATPHQFEKELNEEKHTSIDNWSSWSTLLNSNRSFWIIWLIVVAVGRFLYSIFDRVLLIFTGIVIAIAIESLISFFEKKTSKRRLAILLAYLFLIGLLLSGILVMIPFLINQLGDVISAIVHIATSIEQTLKSTPLQDIIKKLWIYNYLFSFGIDLAEPAYLSYLQSLIQNNISAIITLSSSYAKNAGGMVVNTVWWVISTFVQIGFVLTLSVLVSIEKSSFMWFVHRLSWWSLLARQKILLLFQKLGFWLRTQILLWVYIGITMFIALWLMSLFGFDIPNKLSLATIAALTELIPYIWPLLGGIPVVILATVSYWWMGLILSWTVVFIVQRLENNILIPMLFKQNLGVSPVVIFLCMVLGGVTIGINGVILAIPIAVIITILREK